MDMEKLAVKYEKQRKRQEAEARSRAAIEASCKSKNPNKKGSNLDQKLKQDSDADDCDEGSVAVPNIGPTDFETSSANDGGISQLADGYEIKDASNLGTGPVDDEDGVDHVTSVLETILKRKVVKRGKYRRRIRADEKPRKIDAHLEFDYGNRKKTTSFVVFVQEQRPLCNT